MSAGVFTQREIGGDLFQAATLYLRITHANTHMETHTLDALIKTDGPRESLSFALALSLTQVHTLSHTCTYTFPHTHTLDTPFRQKILDYSANGCTTDHRPALLQTVLLCGLSVGWKCCSSLRQCGCGALCVSVCERMKVCVHTHPGLRSAPMLCSLTKGQVSH